MNPKSYRTPLTLAPGRVRCPVCQAPVYSRAGIHPQCAVRQADLKAKVNSMAVVRQGTTAES